MKRFFLLFIMFLPLGVFAADKASINCDKKEVNVGDQVVCRLSINSSSEYNVVKYNIESMDGFNLVDVRSNYSNLWKVNGEGATATSIVNGLQEFGILLFEATSDGIFNVNINNIEYGVYNDESLKKLDNISYGIKVLSQDNYLTDIKINGVSLSDFNKNSLFYDVDVSDSEVDIEGVLSNKYAKLDGNGKVTISENEEKVVVVLAVTSESNTLRSYVITLNNLNYKDSEDDVYLKDISLKNDLGDSLLIDFKSDVYKYDIEVSKNVNSVNLSGVLSDKDLSFVKGYSGGKIKLLPGNNVVLLKIKNKSNVNVVYVFNIVKPIDLLSNNSYLKSLNINGFDLSFSKKVKNYYLEISRGCKSLDIDATAEDPLAVINVDGNDNLKDGSVVRINVTAQDGTMSTYNVNISIKGFNMLSILYLLIPILIFIVLFKKKDLIVNFIKNINNYDNMSYDKLVDKYNDIYDVNGMTNFYNKLDLDDKRVILIEALTKKIMVNKTDKYLELYKKSKKNSKGKNSKKVVKAKAKRKK